MTEGFQPLSLIFDSASNQLYLMVKEGSSDTQNLVSTYMIEYKQIESKKVAQNIISSFSHVKSTRSSCYLAVSMHFVHVKIHTQSTSHFFQKLSCN